LRIGRKKLKKRERIKNNISVEYHLGSILSYNSNGYSKILRIYWKNFNKSIESIITDEEATINAQLINRLNSFKKSLV